MANTSTAELGTAVASPEPETKWITIEEAEKFERWIGRNFVRRGDAAEAKKFFYKIISIHPYQPMVKKFEDIGTTEDCRYQFNVQKYHRHQTVKTTVRSDQTSTQTLDAPKPVDSHKWVKGLKGEGTWVLADKTANFFMDVELFKKTFELEKLDE